MPSSSSSRSRRERRSESQHSRSVLQSKSNSSSRTEPMRYDFMIVDVFTDVAFGGNQLAVLTDARGLTGDAMQTITREFDFPETTFLLPPSDPKYARRVRIFTPGRELPFAGHPTVGTACALVMLGACG